MSQATIEFIKEVRNHPNADRLDIATVINYECIVQRDQFKVGDMCVLIQPDSVLPLVDTHPWAEPYLKFASKRVKAQKLRGQWSFGIVAPLSILGKDLLTVTDGEDVSERLGIVKYEKTSYNPSERGQDGQIIGSLGRLPAWLPRTDQERWQNMRNLEYLYGNKVDVQIKVDGASTTYALDAFDTFRVFGRTVEWDVNHENWYTRNAKRFNIEEKMRLMSHDINKLIGSKMFAIRGESFGRGINASAHNPYSKLDEGFMVFDIFCPTNYSHPYLPSWVAEVLCKRYEIPFAPIICRNVPLDRNLIDYWDHETERVYPSLLLDSSYLPHNQNWIEQTGNYQTHPFEGVVIKGFDSGFGPFTFKVINKHYDSKEE